MLEHQPDEVRSFLLETSILERLSGGLCNAVTGRAGSQAMLERLERANLFLVPLDEVRGWWRYHQLFADLLRARLQRERPGRVPALHHNAAAWRAASGWPAMPCGHARPPGMPRWAARLVEQQADALWPAAKGRRSAVAGGMPVRSVGFRHGYSLRRRTSPSLAPSQGIDRLLDAAERAGTAHPRSADGAV